MDNSKAVVGIDVSKKKLDVALLVNGKIKAKVVDNSASGHQLLLEWLDKSKVPKDAVQVCMEATGVYYEAVATTLHDAGLVVSVVNPGCIKGFGQSENLRNHARHGSVPPQPAATPVCPTLSGQRDGEEGRNRSGDA